MMQQFEISTLDLKKLKKLIDDFGSYYEDEEDDNQEPWTIDDLDSQRQIGAEIISIFLPIINQNVTS